MSKADADLQVLGQQIRRETTRLQLGAGVRNTILLSGSPRWARCLLVGLSASSPSSATVDFHVSGREAGYDRRWTASVGQFAAIDVTGQPGYTVEITRCSVDNTYVTAVAYSEPADERWWRPVSWYESVAAAGTRQIPSGAIKVLSRVPAPGWSWVARDRAGAAVLFPGPLNTGEEYELPTDEYDAGGAAELVWRIRL